MGAPQNGFTHCSIGHGGTRTPSLGPPTPRLPGAHDARRHWQSTVPRRPPQDRDGALNRFHHEGRRQVPVLKSREAVLADKLRSRVSDVSGGVGTEAPGVTPGPCTHRGTDTVLGQRSPITIALLW